VLQKCTSSTAIPACRGEHKNTFAGVVIHLMALLSEADQV
jgi:hypothetical protein